MKNNIEYYRHDVYSHEHPKFKMLRAEYGWEGEGRFWAINNMIGRSEDCLLDLSEEYNTASLAVDLNMSINCFNKFIKYLIKPCKLLTIENNKITTEIIQDVFESVSSERKRCRDKRRVGSTKGRPKNDRGIFKKNLGEISQSKVKESKVKETKVKDSKIKHLEYVYLKETEYKKLLENFGKEKLDICIEKLDNFIPNSKAGRDYKDHNRVLMGWVNKWYEEEHPTLKFKKTIKLTS